MDRVFATEVSLRPPAQAFGMDTGNLGRKPDQDVQSDTDERLLIAVRSEKDLKRQLGNLKREKEELERQLEQLDQVLKDEREEHDQRRQLHVDRERQLQLQIECLRTENLRLRERLRHHEELQQHHAGSGGAHHELAAVAAVAPGLPEVGAVTDSLE
eukprot:gene2199-2516_t